MARDHANQVCIMKRWKTFDIIVNVLQQLHAASLQPPPPPPLNQGHMVRMMNGEGVDPKDQRQKRLLCCYRWVIILHMVLHSQEEVDRGLEGVEER